jgi:hypothetical protein
VGHRIILVSNHLPIRASKREETGSWEFEWDEDALIYQAQARSSNHLPIAAVIGAHGQRKDQATNAYNASSTGMHMFTLSLLHKHGNLT